MNINENFKNERKIVEKLRIIPTKFPISRLLCVLVYQVWYQINTRLKYLYLMVRKEKFHLNIHEF